jgi:hypothetical protein
MSRLPLIDNAAHYLAPISEIERALRYPYAAPKGGFLLAKGALLRLEQAQLDAEGLLVGRTPVLSVGSNRAPVQLRRKFGDEAVLPVTPARLHDCDIVHTAYVGYYAAVPCTAFPAVGVAVDLNIVWLDAEQLRHMHRTEGIGVAYDYVEMQSVEHQVLVPDGPVYGYAARYGALDTGNGQPAGLAAIPAIGRSFATLDQHQAASLVRRFVAVDDARPLTQFVADMQREKVARDHINEVLRNYAIHPENPPWKVMSVSGLDIDEYL